MPQGSLTPPSPAPVIRRLEVGLRIGGNGHEDGEVGRVGSPLLNLSPNQGVANPGALAGPPVLPKLSKARMGMWSQWPDPDLRCLGRGDDPLRPHLASSHHEEKGHPEFSVAHKHSCSRLSIRSF